MAVVSAFILFGHISIDLAGGGGQFIKLLIALALTFTGALFICRRVIYIVLRRLEIFSVLKLITSVSATTILMHITMLAAYIVLVQEVAPDISLSELIPATIIIMFAASIPISFAGWGIREVSAIYTYGVIGIPLEQALAVSITIGILSLLIAGIISLFYMMVGLPVSKNSEVNETTQKSIRSFNVDRLLCWLIPLTTAILIFFQVYLPVSGGNLNINLADPVVLAGGILFLICYASRYKKNIWRVKHFNVLIGLATFSILLSFLIGYFRFGLIDWAFYNRLLGWFILLGYLATGALLVWAAGEAGTKYLFRVLVATTLVIIGFDYISFWLTWSGLFIDGFTFTGAFSGMTQNANAFVFQLLAVLSLILGMTATRPHKRVDRIENIFLDIAIVFILLAILYAKSRTGYWAALAVLMTVLSLRWIALKRACLILTTTFVLFLLPDVMQWMATTLQNSIQDVSEAVNSNAGNTLSGSANLKLNDASSNAERFKTIYQALDLWYEYPIFGAGLGAFVHTLIESGSQFVVIHSTMIWLLAEFGIVGLSVWLIIFGIIFTSAWRSSGNSREWRAKALVLLLVAFTVFQLPHDIFYQRIFWFLIGFLMVSGKINWHRENVRTNREA